MTMTCRDCWKCEYTTLPDGMQQHRCIEKDEPVKFFEPACENAEEKQCTMCTKEKDDYSYECFLCLTYDYNPYFDRRVIEHE
jgi:hypothetical protein